MSFSSLIYFLPAYFLLLSLCSCVGHAGMGLYTVSVVRFFFFLFYAMRRGTVRWISIAYPDCHEDMPIYTRFNIRHSSYPVSDGVGCGVLFYGDDSLIDIDTLFFALRIDRGNTVWLLLLSC